MEERGERVKNTEERGESRLKGEGGGRERGENVHKSVREEREKGRRGHCMRER